MVGQELLKVLPVYDPPIFENPVAKETKPLKELLKKCPVCGKDFFPRRGKQDKYCSRKCYEKAKTQRRKADTRKRVQRYMHSADEKARKKGKRWTQADDQILMKLIEEGMTQREIAERLKRTVYSVRWRVQKLGLVGGKNVR
jgi:predicted nucleic acid-binding Zn ribbon protein